MLKAINFKLDLAKTTLAVLTTVIFPVAHADSIGNINCGNEIRQGEQIVCDYAIIGNKYKKLFDSQFSNGRNADLAVDVHREVSECGNLQCVEAVIDRQMASPINDQAQMESTKSDDGASVAPVTANDSRSVEQNPLTSVTNEEPKKFDRLDLASYAVLAFAIVWILIKKMNKHTKAAPVSKKARLLDMIPGDERWEDKRKGGHTSSYRGVNVKGGLLPKQALIGGANVEVYFDGECPQWHSVNGSITVYKTDGNLQAFFRGKSDDKDINFLGDIVDLYHVDP